MLQSAIRAVWFQLVTPSRLTVTAEVAGLKAFHATEGQRVETTSTILPSTRI